MIRSCLDDIRPSASTIFRPNPQHNLTGHVCTSHGRVPGKTPPQNLLGNRKTVPLLNDSPAPGPKPTAELQPATRTSLIMGFPHKRRSHNFDTSILRTPLREHAFLSLCDDHQPRICQ